jgi:transposase
MAPPCGLTRALLGDQKKEGESVEQNQARHALGRSRGGFSTKVHLAVDGNGTPLAVMVSPGQDAEISYAPRLVEKLDESNLRPKALAADKGYDSQPFREQLEAKGIKSVVPHRRRHDGSYPDRAAGFDKETYRRRNVVERCVGRLKEFRRVATRYDKLGATYRAFVLLACITEFVSIKLANTA